MHAYYTYPEVNRFGFLNPGLHIWAFQYITISYIFFRYTYSTVYRLFETLTLFISCPNRFRAHVLITLADARDKVRGPNNIYPAGSVLTGKPVDTAQRFQKKELPIIAYLALAFPHLSTSSEGPTPIPMESPRIGVLWPAGAGRPQVRSGSSVVRH